MDINKFKAKLTRYLKGTANETETAVVEAWYRSYKPDEEKELNAADLERIRNAIHTRIEIKAERNAKASFKVFYRVAASVLLVSGLLALMYYAINQKPAPETYTVLQTRPGEVKQLILPDSSVIWVNAASRMRIPSSFNEGKLRELYLDEGEAFFKVKHDTARPFRVKASGLRVQVLGTSFNINAYHKLPFVKVAVATGKVAVSQKNKLLSMLTPGQELTFLLKNNTHTQKKINIAQNQSWKDGDTYLEQASFDELALTCKNLFGIKLKAATPQVSAYQFTIRLHRSLPANETLKAISLMHNTHFRKEGDVVILY